MRTEISDILRLVAKQSRRQVTIRRHFHKHPELSFEEIQTTAYILKELRAVGLKILPVSSRTGVLAELNGALPGPTLAIRTDIDALSVAEMTGLRYRSCRDGIMHACGHDVHMATVLGAVKVLVEIRDQLQGKVRFIFQPGEESPPGGAQPMIADGALKDVSAILGLHVDPHLAVGKIGLRDGVTMASVTDFDLIISGTGGHAARPQTSVDAIVVAAEVVESIQKIVSREIDPIAPVAITFGKIAGGTARNVIADRVVLTGTARALSKAASRRLPKLIKRTATGVCKARGARVEMVTMAGYPVLSNDARVNRLLARNYQTLFGRNKIAKTEPVLGGEDFACYLQKVPGAMFRLGVRNKNIGADQPWHSSRFIVDEESMRFGTALLAATAIDFLSNGFR